VAVPLAIRSVRNRTYLELPSIGIEVA
jgi:hypothetical protein